MEQFDLPVVVGVAVSLVFQLLKKWKWLDATDAIVKQTSVAVLAAVVIGQANSWNITLPVATQMALAALMAWLTHKGLLSGVSSGPEIDVSKLK